MLRSRTTASQRDYLRGFERMNMLVGPWDLPRARAAGLLLVPRLAGRRVLVLGGATRAALRFPKTDPLVWREDSGVHWCLVPHPSGRNLWYNSELNRVAVSILLEELCYHDETVRTIEGPPLAG